MTSIRTGIAWVLSALLPSMAGAASLTTETFAVNASGWTSSGDALWTLTNGYMQARFAEELFPPPPGSAAILSATGGATSGAFTGNYWAADAEWIGFDFFAENTLPAQIGVLLEGTTTLVSRSVAPVQTGVWQRVVVPVTSKVDGSWEGPGSPAFEPIITNVQKLEFVVERNGAAEQTYRIDNIFLGRRHTFNRVSPATGGSIEMEWTDLRPNWPYRVEATTNLPDGVWTNIGGFAPTSGTQVFTDLQAGTNAWRAYRLVLE